MTTLINITIPHIKINMNFDNLSTCNIITITNKFKGTLNIFNKVVLKCSGITWALIV